MRDNYGGITSQVNQLKVSLVKESFECDIISTHGSITYRASSIIKALRLARNYDLILGVGCAFRGFFPIFIASFVSKARGIPVCFNFHDGQAKIFLNKKDSVVKKTIGTKQVVVASPFLYNEFSKRGFNPVLIPNHFDYRSYPDFITKKNRNRIIWARSFEPLYQPELALKVSARLVNEIDCDIHFYGNGSLFEGLKNKYINSRLKIFGLISKDMLLKKYSDYDIFFNTTKYDNFPLSLVEAAYYGLLIVTTSSEGVKSLYSEDEVVFTDISNEDLIYESLKETVNNYKSLTDRIENARNKILSYTWDNVKNKWTDVFQYCLTNN